MKHFLLLSLSLLLFACPDQEDPIRPLLPADCGSAVEILSESNWPDGPNLADASVEAVDGLCVVIRYTWVGCSDQGLPLHLVTNGSVAESSPTQTSATLRFSENTSNSLCAIFENQLDTFDLTGYVGDALPTLLRIEGADTTILLE